MKGYKWFNNGIVNKRAVNNPGDTFVRGRLKHKRKSASEETCKKISEGLKGIPSWNKGLQTKYTHPESDETRDKKSLSAMGNTTNVGREPWNKKILDQNGFAYYNREVRTITERLYYNHKNIINPDNHLRGRSGIPGAYQIDHIVSISEGFEKNIPIENIASIDNLQMLMWEDNSKKSNK